jgi:hypothetical protein
MCKTVSSMETTLKTLVPVFRELITKVDCAYVTYYVSEYFLKLSVILDFCDVLEFGRLRSKQLILSHRKYKFEGKTGSFGKPNVCEQGLELSVCSYDGLNFCMRNHKV